MDNRWPSYPRDDDELGFIPAPLCFDYLSIWAEHGFAYLWDMNGVGITVGQITNVDNDPMDALFEKWQDVYECKEITDDCCPKWDSDQERIEFDEAGRQLAKQLYDYFNGRKTVRYRATDGTEWERQAEPVPLSHEIICGGDRHSVRHDVG